MLCFKVFIEAAIVKNIRSLVESPDCLNHMTDSLFSEAQFTVRKVFAGDSYPRFLKSSMYRAFVEETMEIERPSIVVSKTKPAKKGGCCSGGGVETGEPMDV